MKAMRNNKGFTLIELAIVLVIIGIIVGAVLKGQDLIQNARHKKFINDAGRKFEVAAWTHLDRTGRLPGDTNKNGKIGDGNNEEPGKDLYEKSKLLSSADNPVTIGSFSFFVGFGNDGQKNVLVICPWSNNACSSTVSDDDLEFFKAFDTAIDGSEDGTTGLVRGTTNGITINSTTWLVSNLTSASAAWTSATQALVYYFDRRP